MHVFIEVKMICTLFVNKKFSCMCTNTPPSDKIASVIKSTFIIPDLSCYGKQIPRLRHIFVSPYAFFNPILQEVPASTDVRTLIKTENFRRQVIFLFKVFQEKPQPGRNRNIIYLNFLNYYSLSNLSKTSQGTSKGVPWLQLSGKTALSDMSVHFLRSFDVMTP